MIFITGCNGLVGSFVVRKLLSQNYYVRALRRKESDMSLIKDIENKIEWVEGDISDIQLLEKALQGIEVIIHAAAVVSFSSSDKNAMFKTNVDGTANLVNAALGNNSPLFLHVSSVAALGRRKNLKVIDENIYWENSSYNTNYAVSKYQAELEVWRGVEEGLNAVIVNPSVILGPGNWNCGSTKIFKYVYSQNMFYPKGDMNFVDVRDVADIIIRLMSEKNAWGQRYILNGGTIAYKELFDDIAENFNKEKPSISAGPVLSGIAWRAEYIKSLLTGKSPSLTKETAGVAKHNFIYDNSKISKFLNYKFISSKETIKWVCGELRKKYSVEI